MLFAWTLKVHIYSTRATAWVVMAAAAVLLGAQVVIMLFAWIVNMHVCSIRATIWVIMMAGALLVYTYTFWVHVQVVILHIYITAVQVIAVAGICALMVSVW